MFNILYASCSSLAGILLHSNVIRPRYDHSTTYVMCYDPVAYLRGLLYRGPNYNKMCQRDYVRIRLCVFVLLTEREIRQVVGSAAQFAAYRSVRLQGKSAFVSPK